MSDIAFDMRREIGEMVLDGKSDREILDHYKALYGLQILVILKGPGTRSCMACRPYLQSLVSWRSCFSSEDRSTGKDTMDLPTLALLRSMSTIRGKYNLICGTTSEKRWE